MDVVLLHNKHAGKGDHSGEDLVSLLHAAGYRVDYRDLHQLSDETDFLEKADFVVVAGGDGSLSKTVALLRRSRRPVALLPLGTANNIATSLGLGGPPQEIIAGWAGGHRHKFDVGLATGPWGTCSFLEGIGFGLISRAIAVLKDIKDGIKDDAEREGRLRRDLWTITALAYEIRPIQAELVLDDGAVSGEFLLAEILNTNRAGPGLELAPANPTDGWLDVVLVPARERADFLTKLKDYLARNRQTLGLPSRRCRKIELTMPAGDLRLDGKVLTLSQPSKISIALEPRALEFILPPSAAAANSAAEKAQR